jgi:hypothetical protein
LFCLGSVSVFIIILIRSCKCLYHDLKLVARRLYLGRSSHLHHRDDNDTPARTISPIDLLEHLPNPLDAEIAIGSEIDIHSVFLNDCSWVRSVIPPDNLINSRTTSAPLTLWSASPNAAVFHSPCAVAGVDDDFACA